MKTFACVNDGLVTNIVAAEDSADITALKILLPDEQLIIETTESTGWAFINHKWYSKLKKFQPLKPYESWSWNEADFVWEAPIPMPTDGKDYCWDELTTTWVELVIETTQEVTE